MKFSELGRKKVIFLGRPCKVIDSQSRHNTKEEIEKRKEAEEAVKVSADKIAEPPSYLSEEQKKVYKFIIDELEATGILTNLDVYILCLTAIAVDRLKTIETIINNKPNAIVNKDLMSSKDKYTKDLLRGCNELSLSPQSRAKLGNLALSNKEKADDPLLKALGED